MATELASHFSRARALAKIENYPFVRKYLISRFGQIILDTAIIATSFVAAHILRFSSDLGNFELRRMVLVLPYLVAARIAANVLFGAYRAVWRYTSIHDAIRLAGATGSVSLVLVFFRFAFVHSHLILCIPLGVITIDTLLVTCGMLAVRLFRRITAEAAKTAGLRDATYVERVLLVGAGDAGIMTAREIHARPDLGLDIRGFVDDDRLKIGDVIHGISVLGKTTDLPALVQAHNVTQVIITMASSPRKTIRRIIDLCAQVNVSVKIIPGLYEIIGNQVTVNTLHPVEIEDLLGRDSININKWLEASRPTYFGKRILVTGAGGSIGSELCRQLATVEPRSIIILDKDENAVFFAERDLRKLIDPAKTELIPSVCDVRMEHGLERVFDRFRPEIVFHAAAYKHVPLMELHISEAVQNNVVGTGRLLANCELYGVERCVMVSTDKAVNPTSVMGATKRIAELMFQAQARRSNGKSRYSCVRFGNVLGSQGSVVPIFREQIRQGGPVTITHPDMTRYFMTIPEAAQLIIQSGVLGKNAEIFLLDMGEPVKIVDLARDMIRLSGLIPGDDIDIQFTGTRLGEKLKEELLIAEEGASPTEFDKIFVAAPIEYDFVRLGRSLEALAQAARRSDDELILKLLAEMQIGFRSPLAEVEIRDGGEFCERLSSID